MALTTIENRTYWLKQIKNYKTRGYPSKSAYCRETGVNYARFIYWSEKLGRQLPQGSIATKAKEFIPITVAPKSPHNLATPLCILELKQGHRLLIQNESVLEKIFLLLGR